MAEKTRAEVLLDKLWNEQSPAGQAVRQAAKTMYPEITTPDDTAAIAVAPLKAEVEDLKGQLGKALDRISAREQADADTQTENALAVKITNAARQFSLTDAGRDKMIARMKETGNFSDADAAAAWVHTQTPKPAPTNTPTWLPEAANLFGSQKQEEQFEALHKDPRKYMDDQLRLFSRDPDAYVAETFGTA